MGWKFENDRPIYLQIVEQVKNFIISGEYAAGQKLPSVRDIAADAKVNPNTVQRALSELENCGLLYSNRTSGRFITDDVKLIENMKSEYAEKLVENVCKSLKEFGFSTEQVTDLIKKYMKGGTTDE